MDQYTKTSYRLSEALTKAYSTSFSMSMSLFDRSIRPYIYAIYGLVRVADEIVDTYEGKDKLTRLNTLEKEVFEAIKKQYSINPIIHSFAISARMFAIEDKHISAFFESMRMDLRDITYDQKTYETYIYGSAEVVGLMCLKVFTKDEQLYRKLEKGAKKLGAAYQKVNFLRDIKADALSLKRWYFPFSSFETFDEKAKNRIVLDIEKDFTAARKVVSQLPVSSRSAVQLSIAYYEELLSIIRVTPAEKLKIKRVRVNNIKKTLLLIRTRFIYREA